MSNRDEAPRRRGGADDGDRDDAIDRLTRSTADDVLDETYPMAAVDDELRALGADPDAIATRGRDLAWIELSRERRSWMGRARDRLEAARRMLRRKSELAALGRAELLDRITSIQGDPSLAAPIAAAFRKRSPARASDEELRELLAEMELLRDLAERERGGGGAGPDQS